MKALKRKIDTIITELRELVDKEQACDLVLSWLLCEGYVNRKARVYRSVLREYVFNHPDLN